MTLFQDEHRVIRLISVGAIIQSVEFFVPYPVPGAKIGFANIITIIALYNLDFTAAFRVAFFRPIVGSIISGTFLSAGFMISFISAIVSFMIMWAFFAAGKKFGTFSVYGVSVVGAVFHNLSQIVVVYFWLLKIPETLYLAPVLALAGVASGAFIGYCATHISSKIDLKKHNYIEPVLSQFQLDKKRKLKLSTALLIAASSFFLNSNHYYLGMNTIVMIFIFCKSGFKPKKYLKFFPIIAVLFFLPLLFGRDINYGMLATLRVLLLFHLSMWITNDLTSLSEKIRVAAVDSGTPSEEKQRSVFGRGAMVVINSVICAMTLTQNIKKSELKTPKKIMDGIISLLGGHKLAN